MKPGVCGPQLSSVTSCQGQPCSWTVEVFCEPDGGVDAGADMCAACEQAMPQGAGPPGVCYALASDGGTASFSSGGCGI